MQIYAKYPMGIFEGYGEADAKPALKKFTSWEQLIGHVELEGDIYYQFDGGDTPRKVYCSKAATELVRLRLTKDVNLLVTSARLDLFSYEE